MWCQAGRPSTRLALCVAGLMLLLAGCLDPRAMIDANRNDANNPPGTSASQPLAPPAAAPVSSESVVAAPYSSDTATPSDAAAPAQLKQMPIAGSSNPPGTSAAFEPPAASSPAVTATGVRLTTGTALPQTFPTGIGMTFSVEYQFQSGAPNATCRYFWIIEGRSGPVIQQPVQLGQAGELPLIAPDLKPEAGPFVSYFVEACSGGNPRPLSNRVSMR